MQQKHKSRRKFKNRLLDYRNWLLVLTSIVITLICVELLLQAVHVINPSLLPVEKQSKDYMTTNPFWKVWHYPNKQIDHSYLCMDATYNTNKFGLKDSELDHNKSKIALIGDSYVEGFGVDNDFTISEVIQRNYNDDIEVMNFGTSGGFGNVHAVSMYQNFIVEFDPDIIIVFFLSYNDLYDNIAAVKDGFVTNNLSLSYPLSDSLSVFNLVTNYKEPLFIDHLPKDLFVPYFIKRGIGVTKTYLQVCLNLKFEFSEIIGLPFYKDEPESITKGYQILENSLIRFQELHSPNLILVNLPTPFQVDGNWKKVFEKTHDIEIDILQPNKRVQEITTKLDITLFDPIYDFLEYVDSTEMRYPYFYNECDKHFNEFGYRYMGN